MFPIPNIQTKKIDPVTKRPVLYTHVIPLTCGRWSVANVVDHKTGEISPFVSESYAEVEDDYDDMVVTFLEQIADRERDIDDEWDGFIMPCRIEGEYMVLLSDDDLSEIERFRWRN